MSLALLIIIRPTWHVASIGCPTQKQIWEGRMVVVRSSKNLPLGKTMNDLRTWLDSERIEPVDFKNNRRQV